MIYVARLTNNGHRKSILLLLIGDSHMKPPRNPGGQLKKEKLAHKAA
jgi:hypothetical protein